MFANGALAGACLLTNQYRYSATPWFSAYPTLLQVYAHVRFARQLPPVCFAARREKPHWHTAPMAHSPRRGPYGPPPGTPLLPLTHEMHAAVRRYPTTVRKPHLVESSDVEWCPDL